MNLLELRLYQVKVVEQPLCGWRDVLAAVRDGCDVVVGLAKGDDVVLHSRKKRQAAAPAKSLFNGLRLSKAPAVFFKSLCTKKLGSNQGLWLTRVGAQNFSGVRAKVV